MLLLALLACKDEFEPGDPVVVEVRITDARFDSVLTGSACAGDVCADVDPASGVATLEIPSDERVVLEVSADPDDEKEYVPNLIPLSAAAGTRTITSAHMDRVWHASLAGAVDAVNDGSTGTARFSVTDGVGTPLAGVIASLSQTVGTGPAYLSDDGVRLADAATATTDAGWGLWFDLPPGDTLFLAVDYAGDCEAAGGWAGEDPGSAQVPVQAGAITQIDLLCL
jgi:hypothetical protein